MKQIRKILGLYVTSLGLLCTFHAQSATKEENPRENFDPLGILDEIPDEPPKKDIKVPMEAIPEKKVETAPLRNTGNYAVKELPGGLELNTPYGNVWIPGEFNQTSYKFSIPLKELQDTLTAPNPDKPSEENNEKKPESTPETPNRPTGNTPMLVEYDDTAKLVVEANRLYNRKRYFESLTVVEEILRKRPDYVRAWIMKGSLLKVQGYPDLARNAWEKARDLNPEDPNIQTILQRYQ